MPEVRQAVRPDRDRTRSDQEGEVEVTEIDDVLRAPFEPLTRSNAAATPRKCSHPKQHRQALDAPTGRTWTCLRCGHSPSPEKIRLGRRVGKRGKAHERDGLRSLGITNVGGLNRERDGGDRLDPFVVQWKSFEPGRFPGWMLNEIAKLRAVGLMPEQTPILVITESRQGVKRRGVVVLDLDDWRLLHGPTPEATDAGT